MHLVSDWRRILRHAWSVRLMALSILLSGAASILNLVPDLPVPFWAKVASILLASLSNVGALVARVLPQKEFPDGQAK